MMEKQISVQVKVFYDESNANAFLATKHKDDVRDIKMSCAGTEDSYPTIMVIYTELK